MTHLAAIFPSLLKDAPDDPELQSGIVRMAWKYCLGEKIRNAADPVSFRGGVLYVRVTDPQWKATLESMKHELISRINGYLKRNLLKNLKIEL